MSRATQKPPRTNAAWSEETIGVLRGRAHREFAEQGYVDASVERIAHQAGLTKGAVYYHFGSKAGLFEVVFRDAEREIVRRINARAVAAADPIEAIVAGCDAFLDVALDDDLRRIALVDAPSVLGWSTWRAIDEEFGLGSLTEGLRVCQAAGYLRQTNVDIVAHLISGALNEAVFLIAESQDRAKAHRAVTRAIRPFLRGMVGARAARSRGRRR